MFPEGRILDFMIVGAVALIVVGPKDLPILMRKVGQFVARMRAMAAEFRASFDEIARQSELDELRREVEAMRAGVTFPGVAGAVAGPEARQVIQDIHSGLHEANAEISDQQDLPFDRAESPKTASEETAPPVKADT
jgi:sec-independent protein translocase protein TatB